MTSSFQSWTKSSTKELRLNLKHDSNDIHKIILHKTIIHETTFIRNSVAKVPSKSALSGVSLSMQINNKDFRRFQKSVDCFLPNEFANFSDELKCII